MQYPTSSFSHRDCCIGVSFPLVALEKIFLSQKVVSQLDAHYRDFLTVRMDGEEWEKTAEGMSKWIMEG